jgi:hypothetical protein
MCGAQMLVVVETLEEGDVRHDPVERLAELDELQLPLFYEASVDIDLLGFE